MRTHVYPKVQSQRKRQRNWMQHQRGRAYSAKENLRTDIPEKNEAMVDKP